jgi:hypothetical protein
VLVIGALAAVVASVYRERARRPKLIEALEAIKAIGPLAGRIEWDSATPDQPAITVNLAGRAPAEATTPLEELTGYPALRLRLRWGSDAHLVPLRKLNNVKSLTITGSRDFTDAGLINIRGLWDVEELYLGFTGITGPGLKYLGRMDGLRILSLYESPVTDTGLAYLAGLRDLQELNLACCRRVTDEGLRHVAELHGLKRLDLSATSITDSGLGDLARMPQLAELKISHTAVTRDGLDRIQRALPRLCITSNL